jgi:undecaprenyl-diphosphatase
MDTLSTGDTRASTLDRPSGAPIRERDDIFDAPEDGRADHLGARLGPRHPALTGSAIAVIGLVLLGAIVIGLGLLLTDVLMPGAIGRWDAGVSDWFVARRTPALDTATRYGSDVGATLTIVGIALISSIALGIARRWRAIQFLVTALVLEVSVFLVAAVVVDRPRPDVTRLDVSPPTASYPSGHTAAAIVLYVAIAIIVSSLTANRLLRLLVWAAAMALPVIVAVSRLYRGMHHLTDVLASVVLAAGALLISMLAVRVGSAAAGDRPVERTRTS